MYPEEVYVGYDLEQDEDPEQDEQVESTIPEEDDETEEPPMQVMEEVCAAVTSAVNEAFVQGWKAKSKAAPVENMRGYLPPQQRRSGAASAPPGSNRMAGERRKPDPRGQGSLRGTPGSQGTDVNARKTATSCRSCGNTGRWMGDPQCPDVQSGKVKPFQPKLRPKPVHTVHHTTTAGSGSKPEDSAPPADKSSRFEGRTIVSTRVGAAREAEPERQEKMLRHAEDLVEREASSS